MVRTYYSEYRRQSQSPSHELCREEWIEDFGLCAFVHAATVVGHLNEQIRTGLQLIERPRILVRSAHDPDTRRDGDLARIVSDRLDGIPEQVLRELADPAWIGVYPW